jgi:hypothetical protein
MKLSEVIAKAQSILKEEGDLEVFGEDFYPILNLRVEEADGLPSDYNMPDGMRYVQIQDGR